MVTCVAIIEDAGPETAVGVWFPDLPGCFSAGDPMDEALINAPQAVQLHTEALERGGRQLPRARTLSGPILARSIADDREIVAIGFVDLPDRANLDKTMARIAAQEAVRHDRITNVIESTEFRGICEVSSEFDFSTNAAVDAGRKRAGV